jgi:hypothetical protein
MPNQFTGNNPLNIKQSTYDLIPQIKIDALTMSEKEIKEKYNIHKSTLKKIKDAENITFRKSYKPTGTQKKSLPFTDRYTYEERQELYKRRKATETEQDRINARARDKKYRDKIYASYKMEPSSRVFKDDLWKDIGRSSVEGNRIKLVEGPAYASGSSYDAFKSRKFLDTKTGVTFGYNDVDKYLNSGKIKGVTFDSVIEPYKIKSDIAKSGLREDINKLYFGKKYKGPGLRNPQNTFHVHHIAGVGSDPFKVQLTFADQNLGLITNKKFNKEYSSLVNKNVGFNEKKKFLKNAINRIGPDTAQQFGKKTYGSTGTDIKSLFKKIGMSPNVLEVKDLTNIEGVTTADKAPIPEKSKMLNMFKNFGKAKTAIPAAIMGGMMATGNEAEAAITYNPTIGSIVKTGSDDVASQSNLLEWAADNPEPLTVAGAVGAAGMTKPGSALLKGLIKTLAAPAGIATTAMTVKENMDQGESLPEALADPMAGLGMMGIGAGKLLRMGTPIGAAMTAAGLGKDYYEFAQDEIEKMNQMSDYDRGIYNDMLMDDTNIDF